MNLKKFFFILILSCLGISSAYAGDGFVSAENINGIWTVQNKAVAFRHSIKPPSEYIYSNTVERFTCVEKKHIDDNWSFFEMKLFNQNEPIVVAVFGFNTLGSCLEQCNLTSNRFNQMLESAKAANQYLAINLRANKPDGLFSIPSTVYVPVKNENLDELQNR
jgi:hypothetical protein